MPEPKRYRYTRASLVKDYLLAAAGLALGLTPILLVAPGRVAGVILGSISVLGGVLALRTARRQATVFVLAADSLAHRGRNLPWAELSALRLRHFATRREAPGSGWMELRLSAPGRRITLDSSLGGFLAVARAAHGAALAKGLALDPVTVANLRALGLEVPDRGAPDREDDSAA